MGKLKKALKKVGKAAAIAGAAYAASKMGKGKADGITNYEFDSTYDKAGMGGPKKSSIMDTVRKMNPFGKNPNAATYQPAPGQVDRILDMGVGGAKKGTFVTVKTKMGRNKKTRIC